MARIVAGGEGNRKFWDDIADAAATLSTPDQEDDETEKEFRDHIQNKADTSLLQKMRAEAKAGGLDAIKRSLGLDVPVEPPPAPSRG